MLNPVLETANRDVGDALLEMRFRFGTAWFVSPGPSEGFFWMGSGMLYLGLGLSFWTGCCTIVSRCISLDLSMVSQNYIFFGISIWYHKLLKIYYVDKYFFKKNKEKKGTWEEEA